MVCVGKDLKDPPDSTPYRPHVWVRCHLGMRRSKRVIGRRKHVNSDQNLRKVL